MQPEQQQRIMGYFIEEAKDHLNTIEQGLLNLQRTIEDPEMANELFRAAHSVKGGAAMLGLSSIQQVSHRLEDFFKILKESRVTVDQKLESLFLRTFDALQELLGQLQGPFGLTDETASATVAGVEPTFAELEQHLNVLVQQSGLAQPLSSGFFSESDFQAVPASLSQVDSALAHSFGSEVPAQLREMLQLFKQSEFDSVSRQQLQEICQDLASIGQQFDLYAWCQLIEAAKQAIANPDNPYRTLAPIIIKDIKQAQDLVLSGRAVEIVPCAQLQALVPDQPIPSIAVGDDFADLLATADNADVSLDLFAFSETPEDSLFDDLDATTAAAEVNPFAEMDLGSGLRESSVPTGRGDRNGPEMGMAELNSLADLFEGDEVPDLGSTWQEEEILGEADVLAVSSSSTPDDFDASADFSDLLFDESEASQTISHGSPSDDLSDLFGDDLLEEEISEQDAAGSFDFASPAAGNELEDLLAISTSDPSTISEPAVASQFSFDAEDPFAGLDLGQEGNEENLMKSGLDLTPTEPSGSPLGNDLGELFSGMDDADLALSETADGLEQSLSPLDFEDLDNPFFDAFEPQTDELPVPDATIAASGFDPWAEPATSEPLQSPLTEVSNNGTEDLGDLFGNASVTAFEDSADLGDLFGNEPTPALEDGGDLGDLFGNESISAPEAGADLGGLFGSESAPALEDEGDLGDLFGNEPISASENGVDLGDLFGSEPTPTPEAGADLGDLFGSESVPVLEDEGDLGDLFGNESISASEAGVDLGDLFGSESASTPEAGGDLEDFLDVSNPAESIEELSDQGDADFSGLFEPTSTESQNSSADLLEELTDDGSDLSTTAWLSDAVSLGDEERSLQSDEISDPWNTPEPEVAQPLSLGALELGGLDAEDPLISLDAPIVSETEALSPEFQGIEELQADDELSFDLGELELFDPATDATSQFDAPSDSPAELDLDLNELDFGTPQSSDLNLAGEVNQDMEELMGLEFTTTNPDQFSSAELSDSSDSWLPSESAETVSSSDAAMDDLFAEDLATIAGADAFTEQELNLSSSEDLLNLDAFSEPSAAASISESLDLDNSLDFGDLSLDGLAEDRPEEPTAQTPAFDDPLSFGIDELEEPTAENLDLSEDLFGSEEPGISFDLTELSGLDEVEIAGNGDEGTPQSSSNDFADFDSLLLDEQPASIELGDFDDLLAEKSTPLTNDLSDFDSLLSEQPAAEAAIDEFAGLDSFLEAEPASTTDDFGDLDSLLAQEPSTSTDDFSDFEGLVGDEALAENGFADLDNLLDEPASISPIDSLSAAGGLLSVDATSETADVDDFADLEALLQDDVAEPVAATIPVVEATSDDSEFDELDDLLKDAEEKIGGPSSLMVTRGLPPQNRRLARPGRVFSEQTMRVPVKHLDNLSNLVGELVVNRNSLEQDQERLRQSLDNLLYQVQQLSDVGQRMQDLYERSLLESSLLASRQSYRQGSSLFRDSGGTAIQTTGSSAVEYDPLEMDRFTGFHSLSQEMIELIVRVRESASDIEFIVDETDQVTRMFRQVTTQLQEGLTRSRMVPFAQTADRLPRAVRDIAMKVGKQAELQIEGRETLIDKMILEQLYDPMTHLVNNAITHGIETPDVRRAAGKSPVGKIVVRAFHQGNQTIISFSDDGAGIDVEGVKAKAIEKGLISPAESRSMSRLDVYDLLFQPGFTTKDQADDYAGRGVGMDVVRTSLSEIRGVINTDSNQGKGTTFTIRLPLTLSISKALCCISDRARIAFPMDGVEDMLDIPKDRIQMNAEGQPCLPWRDSLLPLRPLNDLLTYNRHLSRGNVYGGNQEEDIASIVVLRSAGNFLALQVDQVLGEQEIVIKQLEGPIPKPVGVAGATVLGDGRIMPIADVLELIDLAMGRIRKDVGGSLWEQGSTTIVQDPPVTKTEPTVLIVDDSITVRELLSMTFNKVGYRVEQARDGQEAWEKLRAGLPCDIVFCDIEMPRMDGLELLSRIQKDPNLTHLPIAMLTSRGADRHRQMASTLGASGYFTKPYLEEALLDAAQRMLKGEKLL
jgi:chemotaxis protein histidine kinase CheA/ActR/RegA family two-component response regulator